MTVMWIFLLLITFLFVFVFWCTVCCSATR